MRQLDRIVYGVPSFTKILQLYEAPAFYLSSMLQLTGQVKHLPVKLTPAEKSQIPATHNALPKSPNAEFFTLSAEWHVMLMKAVWMRNGHLQMEMVRDPPSGPDGRAPPTGGSLQNKGLPSQSHLFWGSLTTKTIIRHFSLVTIILKETYSLIS